VSRENVELARRYYDAWNSGDTGAVIDALAAEVEWHGHPRLPEPGPYRGREAVGRWMKQFQEAWGELSAKPVELLDAGEGVVALVHMTGTGRGSGVEVRGGVDVHVMRIGDDGATYFRIYPGDEAAGLAGLDDSQMDVLILRVQEELSPSEIAQRSGRSEDEVRAILDRAFTKLRELAPDELPR
jgi:ketosteroid isomerase-like protein